MNGPQTTLIGNVTRDPELKYAANNGTPWVTLRVATNATISPEETETLFWDVTLWRHTAEYAARNIRTGMGVFAQGRFSLRSYTRDDGQQVTVPCLNAYDFEIITRGAPAAESWLEHRPARDAAPPTTETPAAQPPRQQRTGGADMEQRQPRRPARQQPQEDQPAREPAAARQPPLQPHQRVSPKARDHSRLLTHTHHAARTRPEPLPAVHQHPRHRHPRPTDHLVVHRQSLQPSPPALQTGNYQCRHNSRFVRKPKDAHAT